MALTTVQQVVAEVFDSDETVKRQFQENVAAQIVEFAQEFSPLFSAFENFQKDCSGSLQAALVAGLLHGVLDDSLIAVKLLVTGKLGPSGNLIRQAIEGICMAIMCAHVGTLSIGDKKQVYWKLIEADDKAAEGNLAAKQLLKNVDRLGLSSAGVEQIKMAVKAHHKHSHAGRLAMALRMDLGTPGQIYFGGHYDADKLEGYKAELGQIVSVTKWAGEVLHIVWPRIKAWPRDAG
jgi:hypothetical protein